MYAYLDALPLMQSKRHEDKYIHVFIYLDALPLKQSKRRENIYTYMYAYLDVLPSCIMEQKGLINMETLRI